MASIQESRRNELKRNCGRMFATAHKVNFHQVHLADEKLLLLGSVQVAPVFARRFILNA